MTQASAALATYLGISGSSQEGMILRLLIELGAQIVGAQEGSLLVLDEKRHELVFAMTVGSKSSEMALIGQRVPLGKGITGLAAQTHEVQIGAPPLRPRQPKRHNTPANQPQAVLAAPMLVADRLIGVLTAVSFAPDKRFASADALLYGRIAAVAGVVVNQSRQLNILSALQRGHRPPQALNQTERFERDITRAITRLTACKPHAKPQIARLLTAMATLLEE